MHPAAIVLVLSPAAFSLGTGFHSLDPTAPASLGVAQQQAAGPQLPGDPQAFPLGRTLVSGYNSDAIHVYDTATGAFEQAIAPVPGAQSIVASPSGLLYVCAEKIDEVLRIDPLTLSIVDSFVFDDPLTMEDETGGLSGPTAATFGPDGNLYVASFNTDEVLRYDGATGAFVDVFVTAGSGALNGPDAGTTFGPDGDLYVPSFWNNRVLIYDGGTGAHLGALILGLAAGVSQPRDVKFRDGYAYVASSGNNRVLRVDPSDGSVVTFATTTTPYSLAFHLDNRDLYVANLGPDTVSRHSGVTGVFRNTPVRAGDGGLLGATYVFLLRP